MSNPIRLGFIGCGGHSRRHAAVVQRMPDKYRIVAACDVKQDVAEKFLIDYGVRAPNLATINISELLEYNGLDAVLIGTPHEYHLEQAGAAVKAGKHVLCEKPLWANGNINWTGRYMIKKAKERGLIFSSCHLRRYEREYMHVKEHIVEYLERFGPAVEVRFQFFYHEPSTGWKMEDSLLLDHMNHEIDLVHFLFGYSFTRFWRLSHSFDAYQVAGKTENGLGIWFSGYRKLRGRTFRNELEIVFEWGRVRTQVVLNSETGMVSSSVSTLSFEDDSETLIRFRPHSYDDALVGVMDNFAKAIRGEESCYLTAQDLVVNTTICNDLTESDYASI